MVAIKYNEEDLVSHHGIAAVIKDPKGAVLMQEHVKFGFWTVPVGKVKSGMSVEEGLKEELLEECNISIKEFREIRSRKYIYIRDGRKVTVDAHLFEVLNYSGRLKNNEPQKHTKQLFLPLEEIKRLPYLSDLTVLYLDTIGYKRKARL